MWNLKRWHWWIYSQGSNGEIDIQNRHREMVGGEEGEGEIYGESNIEIYNTLCKTESQRDFAVWLRELKQGLCNRLKGGEEREMGRRGHGYTYGWFLLMYDRKPQNSVKQLSFNQKNRETSGMWNASMFSQMENRKRDTDVQNRLLDSVGEGDGGMFRENSIERSMLSRSKQITSQGWMPETGAQGWCTGKTQRDGMGWRVRREGGSGWGTRVNPWLIHVNVWQQPLQYCKTISLQWIKINGKKNKLEQAKKKW